MTVGIAVVAAVVVVLGVMNISRLARLPAQAKSHVGDAKGFADVVVRRTIANVMGTVLLVLAGLLVGYAIDTGGEGTVYLGPLLDLVSNVATFIGLPLAVVWLVVGALVWQPAGVWIAQFKETWQRRGKGGHDGRKELG